MQRRFSSTEHATEFSLRLIALLRSEGVRLGGLQSLACTNAIDLLGLVEPDGLLRVYRATLINRKDDLTVLQRLFGLLLEMHFSPSNLTQSELEFIDHGEQRDLKQALTLSDSDKSAEDGESTTARAYSTREVDHHQDFRFMTEADYPKVLAILDRIARRYAQLSRRKFKKAKRGRVVDLRASMRESVRFDGDIVDWHYKRKQATHTHLTVVVDVSGSMEIYAVFLLNFLHLINQHRRLKIEVFVFSTELQPLTKEFRSKGFRTMLTKIAARFSGWSGGTKIGHAIRALNETHRGSVSEKTLVAIMSDGWDTGETELLDREMARLKARAKSVIWINPLKGNPDYQPLALGMATAKPYCDDFISGHSIDALDLAAARIL